MAISYLEHKSFPIEILPYMVYDTDTELDEDVTTHVVAGQ